MTAREQSDVGLVGLVGLGESFEHALGLIERIVREAACPVIVLIHARDPDFVREASTRGIFSLHHRRRGLAELDPHRAAPVRRVLRPKAAPARPFAAPRGSHRVRRARR